MKRKSDQLNDSVSNDEAPTETPPLEKSAPKLNSPAFRPILLKTTESAFKRPRTDTPVTSELPDYISNVGTSPKPNRENVVAPRQTVVVARAPGPIQLLAEPSFEAAPCVNIVKMSVAAHCFADANKLAEFRRACPATTQHPASSPLQCLSRPCFPLLPLVDRVAPWSHCRCRKRS